MKKIIIVVVLLFAIMIPTLGYAETISFSAFDPSVELTSHYALKQLLNGQTTRSKKNKGEIYLEYPYEKEPYMYFSKFVVDGPTNQYGGFMETIYYRDSIKIRDMYYEKIQFIQIKQEYTLLTCVLPPKKGSFIIIKMFRT